MSGLLELISNLESGSDFHLVDLAAELLRVCRRQAAALRTAKRSSRYWKEFERTLHAVAAYVEERQRLDSDLARALARFLRDRLAAGVPEVLIARAAAEGIDQGAGQRFAGRFHGTTLELGPGDPFPVSPSITRTWVRMPTGNPDNRNEGIDRLPHLRIAPDDLRGLRVSIHWCGARLAELGYVERFGIGVLHKEDELADYVWERYSVEGKPVFFHVRPEREAAQMSRIRAVLDEARKRNVDLLLLPELCLTESMHKALYEEGAFKSLRFLVAGSWHRPSSQGPGHNECVLYAKGRQLGHHRKFCPASFKDHKDDNLDDREVTRLEHLDSEEARIHVFACGNWSLAMLICKDAMDTAVLDVLRELAVPLVLIPAMSPKVDDFTDLARQVGRDPQGYTLIANTGATHAIIGTPSRFNRVQTYASSGAPDVLVFDREGELLSVWLDMGRR